MKWYVNTCVLKAGIFRQDSRNFMRRETDIGILSIEDYNNERE